jgi:hypothetical protein
MTSVSAEEIEAALDVSGLPWCRRDTGWAVPAADGVPRELHVSETLDGVRVEAILVEWDEAADEARQALAQFLGAAEVSLLNARCEVDGSQARVFAFVGGAELEAGLTHALFGVSAGCRFLAREARALLVPEMARHYLQFHAR